MAPSQSRFQLREHHLNAIKAALDINEEEIVKVIAAFKTVSLSIDIDYIASSISDETSINEDKVHSLIHFFWQASLNQMRSGVTPADFIVDLTDYLDSLPPDEWDENHRELWRNLKGVIIDLFDDNSNFYISVKAADLLFEQEKIFCTVRIITDLRPIFNDDAETIRAFIPYHNMVIKYHENGDTKEIHLALDHSDLKMLESQVERAKSKESLVKTELNSKDINLVDTGAHRKP